MRTTLDRRTNESVRDYVLRLLDDPMTEGFVDEVALLAKVSTDRVREIRGDDQIWQSAELVAMDVGWSGPRHELVIAALTHYALSACGASRCAHERCAAQRLHRAPDGSSLANARPAHDTRHHGALGGSDDLSAGARPGEQSRGAPGPRNPGGT
mgnify:CR=1 FL=1